jgi:hypothetical protein
LATEQDVLTGAKMPDASGKVSTQSATEQRLMNLTWLSGTSALLGTIFSVYAATVFASALGAAPLSSRGLALALLALGAVVGTVLVTARASRARDRDHSSLQPKLGRLCVALFACSLLVLALLIVLSLTLPVGAYDALGYRLPAVAQWLDAGSIAWVSGDDALRNGYPLGSEVVEAVIMRATGSSAAVELVSILLIIAGGFAVAAFACELSLPRPLCMLAFALFTLVPMHVLNAPSGYADAALAGAVAMLFVFSALWVRRERPERMILAQLGLAAGLVMAVKPNGIAFVGLALTFAFLARTRRHGLAASVRQAAFMLPFAAAGAFFLVRNLVHTKNPLYPVEVKLLGKVVFPGAGSLDDILTPDFNVPDVLKDMPGWKRVLWVWLEFKGPATDFDDRLSGLGLSFALVGVPALLWAGARARKEPELEGLGLMLLATALAFLVQPLAFWPRLTSWLWAPAAICIALGLARLASAEKHVRATRIATLLCVLVPSEAAYALAHVKNLNRYGLTLFEADSLDVLARVSGAKLAFIRDELAGKRHVCRTPWVLGTDDANIDGLAAQLSPRPRMHVIQEQSWDRLGRAVAEAGCDDLIVIGKSPLLDTAPREAQSSIREVTAFGPCHVVRFPLKVSP